jgi:hypothetical protein
MMLRDPLFQLYVLGMDETGIRERPFKRIVPEPEPELPAEDGEAGGEGDGGAEVRDLAAWGSSRL